MFAKLLLSGYMALVGSFSTAATTTSASPVHLAQAMQAPEYEQLEGFVGVVVNQINAVFGTERLPAANGFPVEPGVYVAIGDKQMTIWDETVATLSGGTPSDKTAAAECRSGCSRVFYDAFRVQWLKLVNEAAAVEAQVPVRVLLGADASIPARTLVDAAYAAAESRPGSVPNLSILLNNGPGGLRARSFFLVPPEGLQVPASQGPLGLTIDVLGGGNFELRSADPRKVPTKKVAGAEELAAALTVLDRQFPSKDVLIVRPGPQALVGDLVQAMSTSGDRFPLTVVALDASVGVGPG